MLELSEQEIQELSELRTTSQRLKEQINLVSSELEDNYMALNNLKKWKKNRYWGFSVCFVIYAIFLVLMFLNLDPTGISTAEKGLTLNGTISYSIYSTTFIFSFILLLAISLFTIIVGLLLVMELGKSSFARKLAKTFGKKNYYTVYDEYAPQTKLLEESLQFLINERKNVTNKLEKLESREVPWYMQ